MTRPRWRWLGYHPHALERAGHSPAARRLIVNLGDQRALAKALEITCRSVVHDQKRSFERPARPRQPYLPPQIAWSQGGNIANTAGLSQ